MIPRAFVLLVLLSGITAVEQGLVQPELPGLSACHVLSSRWIIAVVPTSEAVVAAMDRRTGGAYSGLCKTWRETAQSTRPDWHARRQSEELRALWWGAARSDAGEATLDQPNRWLIFGPDNQVGRPLRATRAAVGLDAGNPGKGEGEVAYATYVYLELPFACVEGGAYTVRLDGLEVARWTWSDDRTLSRAIKVNQVGYRPGDPLKVAYVGGWLQDLGPLPIADNLHFSLVDADTGKIACEGPVVLRDDVSQVALKPNEPSGTEKPLLTGERVFTCDFTACNTPGRYYVRIAGIGRSWAFPIDADVYGEAFYVAMRGLFHQRASFALDQRFTPWSRKRYHTAPVYESANIIFPPGDTGAPQDFNYFDVIGGSTDLSHPTNDVVGGWYDAADFDRNHRAYTILGDLLALYEMRPEVFTDNQLNIPESGNGIPDLLDEAEFGLRVWLRSQDANGGVAGAVETNTHPSIDDVEHRWTFSRRTRYPTLLFAAAAAQYARLVRPFHRDLSWTYTVASRKALAFAENPANKLGTIQIPARHQRGAGDAYSMTWTDSDQPLIPFLLAAKLQVFLNGEDELALIGLSDLMEHVPLPGVHPYAVTDHTPWSPLPLLVQMQARFPLRKLKRLQEHYRDHAAELVSFTESMPYRMTWPRWQNYWMSWGSTVMTNYNRFLFAADRVKVDASRQSAVLANAATMFGCNPLGMSWTTGIGECYPVVLQHEWSMNDGIADPMPGITLYGITEGTYKELREQVWNAPDGNGGICNFTRLPERPQWRCWSPHPTLNTPQCEFTVHETMSSTILTCGMLMPVGWKPSAELLRRGPRPVERLHGRWYVP